MKFKLISFNKFVSSSIFFSASWRHQYEILFPEWCSSSEDYGYLGQARVLPYIIVDSFNLIIYFVFCLKYISNLQKTKRRKRSTLFTRSGEVRFFFIRWKQKCSHFFKGCPPLTRSRGVQWCYLFNVHCLYISIMNTQLFTIKNVH